MKKWEEKNRLKNYQKKIVNAKSVVQKTNSNKSIDMKSPVGYSKSPIGSNPKLSPGRLSHNSSTFSANSSISGYTDYEKEDLNRVPLYKMLKHYTLQQYSKALITRDFGYDLTKLARLTRIEVDRLMNDIKMLPGHRVKFLKLVSMINQICLEIMDAEDTKQFKHLMFSNQYQQPSTKPQSAYAQTRTAVRDTKGYDKKPSTSQAGRKPSFNTSATTMRAPANTSGLNKTDRQYVSQGGSTKSFGRADSASLSKTSSVPNMKRGRPKTKEEKSKKKIEKIGFDFFTDSQQSIDDEFTKVLDDVIHKYKEESGDTPTAFPIKYQNTSKQQTKPKQYFKQSSFPSTTSNSKKNLALSEESNSLLYKVLSNDQQSNDKLDIVRLYEAGSTTSQKSSGSKLHNNSNQNQPKVQNFNTSEYSQHSSARKEPSERWNTPAEDEEEEEIEDPYQEQKYEEEIEEDDDDDFDEGHEIDYYGANKNKKSDADRLVENYLSSEEKNIYNMPSTSSKNTAHSKLRDGAPSPIQEQSETDMTISNNNVDDYKPRIGMAMDDNITSKNYRVQVEVMRPKSAAKSGKKTITQQQSKAAEETESATTKNSSNQSLVEEQAEVEKAGIVEKLEKKLNSDNLTHDKFNTEMRKIKDMYSSFDGAKMTSTIVNLDIEEMCYCLGCAIQKHLEFFVEQVLPNNDFSYREYSEMAYSQIRASQEANLQNNNVQEVKVNYFKGIEGMEENQSSVTDSAEAHLKLYELEKLKSQDDLYLNKQSTFDNLNKDDIKAQLSEYRTLSKDTIDKAEESKQNTGREIYLASDHLGNTEEDPYSTNERNEFIDEQQQGDQQVLRGNSQLYRKDDQDEVNMGGSTLLNDEKEEADIQELIEEPAELGADDLFKRRAGSLAVISERTHETSKTNTLIQDQSGHRSQNKSKRDDPEDDQIQNFLRESLRESVANMKQQLSSLPEFQMGATYATSDKQANKENRIDSRRYAEESEFDELGGTRDAYYAAGGGEDMYNIGGEGVEDQIVESRNDHGEEEDSAEVNQRIYEEYKRGQLEENNGNPEMDFSFESKFSEVTMSYADMDMEKKVFLKFEDTFNEPNLQPEDYVQKINNKPTQTLISNFCKNIIITSKMEKEVAIICLIYIERLVTKSGMFLNGVNWKRITFGALIIASKIWDDESFENNNFAQVFTQYTTREINQIEKVFLELVDYEINVNSNDYAKYYFILRTFAEKSKKSFPLKALDVQTVLKLQKKSADTAVSLKQHYLQNLNKTFC